MPSVYPIAVLPSSFRGHYPNMAKRDVEVWARFLTNFAERFEAFSYDVAMGGVVTSLPDDQPQDRLAWQYKTALKIDAVGYTPREVWIIEVRPEAQSSALGNVIAYTLIAEREALFGLPLRSVIVCEYIQPDVAWCAAQLNVQVFKV